MMSNHKTTIHSAESLVDGKSTATSFFDMTDEEISALAKQATSAAVKDLHARGISTYGMMRDGIMYETKPNGERVVVG
ncbi:hypothetical protein [Chamaesiphon sp. OTE_8_metabat_110]|uniref:hypothetical protein n=1 Tax=Chamaesiphon sp. OTE_8_metabat_110 TaxID=2964696 RepID=UPI00286B3F32|nr:hypothetical protein [Chamaesiphon sp. OTE_8_metabat_110]